MMPEVFAPRNKSERNGTTGTLSPRQETIAVAIASGMSPSAVSEKYKVGRTTLWNWLKHPELKARIDELRNQSIDAVKGKLSELLALAAKTYQDLLENQATPPKLKKEVADSVMDRFVGLSNFSELRLEIEKIKAQQSQHGASPCGI
jgi:hypothetical protein